MPHPERLPNGPTRRGADTLSLRLRADTRAEHQAVERCTGWPDSIGDVAAYRRCLRGLLSLWRPLEAGSADPAGWGGVTAGALHRSRLPALEGDLRALGEDPATVRMLDVAAPTDLPGRIGTFYVLEGSALGGRVIRADLLRRLGPELAGATAFFSGHPVGTGPSWRDIVLAIDAFGAKRPDDQAAVVAGARAAFGAFLRAFGNGGDAAG